MTYDERKKKATEIEFSLMKAVRAAQKMLEESIRNRDSIIINNLKGILIQTRNTIGEELSYANSEY